MSTTFTTKRTTICECGEQLSECDDVAQHGQAPGSGDLTVCVYCGLVFKFDEDRIARKASSGDIATFRALKEYPILVAAIKDYRRRYGIASRLKHKL